MKGALKFSVATNIALLVLTLYLAGRVWNTDRSPQEHSSTTPTFAGEQTAAALPPQREPRQFRWSQIESPDYRTYVANLRGIECPEETIRDIINADVHTLYAPRVEALEKQEAELEKSPVTTGVLARQSIKAELQKLRDDEAGVLSNLLDAPPGSRDVASAVSSRVLRNHASDRVVMPVVFQYIDPTTMKLDSRQLEIVDELRQKFQEDLAGPNQDPNDPVYRKQWQAAQRESDDMLACTLGGQFFLDYQLQTDQPLP